MASDVCGIHHRYDLKGPYINIWGNVAIGDGTSIGAFSEIGGTDSWVTEIGSNCRIQAFAYICPGTWIGNYVFIGPRVTFLNDKYPPAAFSEWRPVVVESGVAIGGGVVLLPGVRIGSGAKIGAGAIVSRNVPANTVVVGNPARELKVDW